MGDIGTHFPDSDEGYRGANSLLLLGRVTELLLSEGFHVVNIDATILAEAPKMRPHIEEMRDNLARACGIEISRVNVKATTEEGLGFTGEKRGIAAHAVCLIDRAE